MSELSDEMNLNETLVETLDETKYGRIRKVGQLFAKATFGASIVAASFAEGLFLASVAPTTVPFGNGEAQATVSFDGNITAEAGLIGSGKKPIEDPATLGPFEFGVNFMVGEIAQPPYKNPELNTRATSLENIITHVDERTISYYGEVYRSIGRDKNEISTDIKNHILRLSALSGAANSGLVVLGASLGKEGRRRLLKNPGLYLSAVALSSIIVTVQPNAPSHDWQAVSKVFNGTELEDVQISGGVANLLVNNLGKGVMEYVQETDDFYKKAKESARESLKNKWLISDEYRRNDDVDLILFYTDNHCNSGTPSVMASAAEQMGINLAADGGDTTASGTKIEDLCVKTTVEAFKRSEVQLVQVPGNHDSSETSRQMRSRGAKVLDGDIITVRGISFLGDADPRTSSLGEPIRQVTGRSVEDVGMELKNKACQQGQPPILLVHDRGAAEEAIKSGCAKLALTGHTHNQKISSFELTDGSSGHILTGGSSGGAKENQITYGPLQGPAQFFVVAVEDGELVAVQDFRINTDSSFVVGDIEKFSD